MPTEPFPVHTHNARNVRGHKRSTPGPSQQKTFQGINFWELLYADDTMIVARSTILAKRIVHLIEEESEYYDLKLNHDKCNFISFNYKANILFKDSSPMKRVEEAVYLGANITRDIEPRLEIRRRISMTMPILKKARYLLE